MFGDHVAGRDRLRISLACVASSNSENRPDFGSWKPLRLPSQLKIPYRRAPRRTTRSDASNLRPAAQLSVAFARRRAVNERLNPRPPDHACECRKLWPVALKRGCTASFKPFKQTMRDWRLLSEAVSAVCFAPICESQFPFMQMKEK